MKYMSPEAENVSIDHMKISDNIKREILLKMIECNAFTEKTAIKIEILNLQGDERIAFDQLVHEEEILVQDKEGVLSYFLAEHYKSTKSYRKQVVQGLSIPLLLFVVLLLTAGVVVVVYQMITVLF